MRLIFISLFLFCSVFILSPAAKAQTLKASATVTECPDWTHQMTFVNNCSSSVWIKTVAGCYDPPDGRTCWPVTWPGNFELKPGQKNAQTITIQSCWSGNFQVNLSKEGGQNNSTLVEITFDGGLENNGTKINSLLDTYDISMVDGFTKTATIAPVPGIAQGGGNCGTAGCPDVPECPEKLRLPDGSCISPCQWYVRNDPNSKDRNKYCCVCSYKEPITCAYPPNSTNINPACLGSYGCSPYSEPGKSNPSATCCPWPGDDPNHPECAYNLNHPERVWDDWALDYIAQIQQSCPGQYSWQYDDTTSTFNCQGKNAPMNYQVTICAGD